jgi:hypothetical protein
MKNQKCNYVCDVATCKHESPAEANFTEARKTAESKGWFIRPSDSKPEHICESCVESTLLATVPHGKAEDG